MTDVIAREVFGLLYETSTEAVFVVDRPTERVVSANVRTEEMLSREIGSLIGVSLAELSYEARDLRAPGHYEDVALRGGDDYPVYTELNVIHVQTAGRDLAAYTARDTSEHRSLSRELVAKHTALFLAHTDLERAHAQLGSAKRALEASNREIAMLAGRATMGELVAGIAHHLNNPVGALASTLRRLSAAVAQAPDTAGGELARLAVRAGKLARRIETSVGAIVDASRLGRTDRAAAGAEPGGRELPPELTAALAMFAAELEELPTKDSP